MREIKRSVFEENQRVEDDKNLEQFKGLKEDLNLTERIFKLKTSDFNKEGSHSFFTTIPLPANASEQHKLILALGRALEDILEDEESGELKTGMDVNDKGYYNILLNYIKEITA